MMKLFAIGIWLLAVIYGCIVHIMDMLSDPPEPDKEFSYNAMRDRM